MNDYNQHRVFLIIYAIINYSPKPIVAALTEDWGPETGVNSLFSPVFGLPSPVLGCINTVAE